MTFEHQEGKGSLFRERNKDNPRAPDMKGRAKLNGEDIYISAWESDRFDGLSLSIETQAERDERLGAQDPPRRDAAAPAPRPAGVGEDDDIPF